MLAVIVLATIATWGVVLPRLERLASVAERIKRNESRGIDPSARYFTDHPASGRHQERIERLVVEHRDAFWRPSDAR
jgi:hypothetical protein